MKKITSFLLASALTVGYSFGQSILEAPADNNTTSQFRAPNGTNLHAFQRTVFYISHQELLPYNLATINSFSFQYTAGATIPVTGNFTVYMQNTTDLQYLKGTNFATAIGPMTTVYNGLYTVPAGTGSVNVAVPMTTAFNYNGGGLYVAYDWTSTGPFASTGATYLCNNDNLWCATADASVTPVPNTLGGSFFRPSLLFNITNTATNEMEMLSVTAEGKVSKIEGGQNVVTARIVNSSIGALNSVSVGLTVTGANPTVAVVTIPNFPAGAVNTVTFNTSANVLGLNTISVAIISNDQIPGNNVKSWTQSVTCNEKAINIPNPTFNNAYGLNSPGIFVAPHTIATNASLTAIRCGIGTSTANIGKDVYGALLDASGVLIATSINTVVITNANAGTFVSFNFNKEPLTANTNYLFGIAQPTTGYFPAAFMDYTATPVPDYYSFTPINGGVVTPLNGLGGFFGIEPNFIYSSNQIVASASKSVVCKSSPLTVSLTASGADSYTWSAVGLGNGSTALYTPSVAGTATLTQVTVVGSYTSGAAQGCRSNTVSMLFSLSACTGVAENVGATAIKVMPNPAVAGKTTISNLSGLNTITVFNTLGQVIINRVSSDESESIDLSDFPSGNYLVRITDNSNETRTVKIINQN